MPDPKPKIPDPPVPYGQLVDRMAGPADDFLSQGSRAYDQIMELGRRLDRANQPPRITLPMALRAYFSLRSSSPRYRPPVIGARAIFEANATG